MESSTKQSESRHLELVAPSSLFSPLKFVSIGVGLGEEGYCQLWLKCHCQGSEQWFAIVLLCSVLVCNYVVILQRTNTLINLLCTCACVCVQLVLGAACMQEPDLSSTREPN